MQFPVLTDVIIDFGSFQAYEVEPLNVPVVLSGCPLIIFGKWKGTPAGTMKVTGITGKPDFSWNCNVAEVTPSEKHQALKYLLAPEKNRNLGDMGTADDKTKELVTVLGLRYNLLTNYTSFIAIDLVVHNAGGKQTTVNQPLPMHQGVGDDSIAELSVGSTGYKSSGGAVRGSIQPVKCSH